MDKNRIELENKILMSRLPQNAYKFMDLDTASPYLLIPAKTRNGMLCILRIDLSGFPEQSPDVYVTKMLKDKDGNLLDKKNDDMYVGDSKYGYTHIRDLYYEHWSQSLSLWQLYCMYNMWLYMYESHLATGKTVKEYLCNDSDA